MKRRSIKSPRKGETWDLLKTSWRYHTGEFFKKSTLHGVRYIAEEGRPFGERFIWFCLSSTGTIVTLIIIASLWDKFQTNPTITGLDTDFHNWEVPFPTLTLCPEVPMDETLALNYVKSEWGNVTTMVQGDYLEYVKTITLLNIDNLDSITKFYPDPTHPNIPVTNFADILYKVVVSCEDVIVNCEWKGTPYNCCEGFTTILTEVGFCFTFNSRHSRGANDNLRIEDKTFKPQLIYETDYKWTFGMHLQKNNIKVYIHSSEEVPSMDTPPQHIWTRKNNKILFSVKYTYTTDEVRQLSVRQRHCIFPDEIRLLTATNYTYSTCMAECRMEHAKKLCGCVPFFYKELANFPHCDLWGLTCLGKNQVELLREQSCTCELGCMNTVYEVDKLVDAQGDNDTSLEIGFVSWPMIRYKREVLFGWVDLLAFGGIAGLFLGFSLLSGVEIVYYFTMRAWCMVYRNKDELRQLKQEYETQPRPQINLDLKPYFINDNKVDLTKKRFIEKKLPVYTVPYLN